MVLYVGLDVSLRTISVCIVEAKGKVVWEGKVLCERPALIAALAPYRKKIKSVGIEAGPLSDRMPLQRRVHRGAPRPPVPLVAPEQDRPQ
jgi:hypothetical protein